MIATRHAAHRARERAPWLCLSALSSVIVQNQCWLSLGFWKKTKALSVVAVCRTGKSRVFYEVRTTDAVCFAVADHDFSPPVIVTILAADARVWNGNRVAPTTFALSALALIARSDPSRPPIVLPERERQTKRPTGQENQ